jgi:hypothetical protein
MAMRRLAEEKATGKPFGISMNFPAKRSRPLHHQFLSKDLVWGEKSLPLGKLLSQALAELGLSKSTLEHISTF